MSDKTSEEQELSRNEVADHLQALAREIRGEGPADVAVGNKSVALAPASVIEYDITVEERSPMLGGERETITVTLDWEVEKSD
ncbi:MAG: amphi-Trp domain-containing protein [Halalkalicoccus sp.]